MAISGSELDVYETSSFSSLIQQEQSEEIIPLDIHAACLIGDVETLQDFIRRKADLNKVNRGGWTPLMYAANVGRDNILKVLLDANAEINIQSTKQGHTALMLASYCASESIICFLLQNGACINMQDHSGRTSLFHAVKQGHQSAVNLLASYGADVNLSEYNSGLSPIMEAAISGHENIFNILLGHGASLNQRTKTGETVRHLAHRNGHALIVNLIDVANKPVCPSVPEQLTIDINQGPRAFEQLCMNTTSASSSLKSVESNNETDNNVQDMDKYAARCSRWQPSSCLPPKIHKLFEEFNVVPYLPLFEKQGIDVDAFLILTDDDLKAMGVDKLGPRKRMKLAIDKYRQMKSCNSDISMKTCNNELEPSQNEEIERLNVQLQQAMSYIQQHEPYIQQHEQHEQQYRKQCRDFAKYVEAEQQRMSQIMFYMKDIGKNCKEAIGQLRKIKDHHRRMETLLADIKAHPNNENILSDLRIDSTLYESANSVKCEIEMATNRLDMTYKQVERTLGVAQMNMPQENHSQ